MISRRGVFRAAAGMAAMPLVNVRAAAADVTEFPHAGVELASMKWFNRARGFGFLHGLESKHDIFVTKEVMEGLDLKKALSLRYLVAWKLQARGAVATEIRGVRPWTEDELAQEAKKWIERQGGLA